MSQINVNPPGPPDTGDRTAAAGINLITVLIVLAVAVVVLWFLFFGPLRATFGGPTPQQPGTQPTVTAPAPGGGQPVQPTVAPPALGTPGSR